MIAVKGQGHAYSFNVGGPEDFEHYLTPLRFESYELKCQGWRQGEH